MGYSNRCGCTVLLIAFGLLTGVSNAQEQPPSDWDVIRKGVQVPSEKLRKHLASVAGVFDIGGYSAGAGYVFICREDDPVIFFFDNGLGRWEQGHCVIEDSRLCLGSDANSECIELRTMPGWQGLFLTFEEDSNAFSADEIALLKELPATWLGTLPISTDALLDASGVIDFGPVAFTLPTEADFVLLQGSGFPLGLTYGEKDFGDFRVTTEIVGWPEYYVMPVAARSPRIGERELAEAQLADWEEGYRHRDLGEYLGSTYEILRYETKKVTSERGSCIRIREDIGVVQSEGGWKISPALTNYFRQVCITPFGGAFVMIATALDDPESDEAVAKFEAASLAVFDSLRLGFASSN